MYLGEKQDEGGRQVSVHKCDTCGTEFALCPPVGESEPGWENCLTDDCASYDPSRDAEILFMSDAEIAREKSVVSMDMLRKRANKDYG